MKITEWGPETWMLFHTIVEKFMMISIILVKTIFFKL